MKRQDGFCYPSLGYGVGLRTVHYDYILENTPPVDWFECVTEDFFVPGGRPFYYLEKVREQYPLVFHGVSMSIGSTDPINWDYFHQLKALIDRMQPAWISDHLCWTGVDGINLHDLLPLPYTQESLDFVVSRIQQVQDFLGMRIAIENPSSYITFKTSDMTEWEFLSEMATRADCLLLLDINNIYVSAFNHGFDACEYINTVPADRIQYFHIAGHTNMGDYIIDTHDHPVIPDVWSLYRYAKNRFGEQVSTLLERDANIPPFEELLAELDYARSFSRMTNEEAIV